jgi:hypothetical protein
MGATKTLINTTMVIPQLEESSFEEEMLQRFEVRSYRVLPNTDKLKKENANFRKLLKQKKDILWQIGTFINKYNTQ